METPETRVDRLIGEIVEDAIGYVGSDVREEVRSEIWHVIRNAQESVAREREEA